MSALANLFARKQIAGTLTGPIPDVIKPELPAAVAKLEAQTHAEFKEAVTPEPPHVEASAAAAPKETEAK
jgi:hypothetical protein